MAQNEKPTAAFVLSLLAGLFILIGGGAMSMLGWGFGRMMGNWGGMMGSGYGMMGLGYGMLGIAFGMMGIISLIFGVIIVIAALMLNSNPKEHNTWGIVILIFSVLSIFGGAMGGFGIGLILGIVGGILAITWKPPQGTAKT